MSDALPLPPPLQSPEAAGSESIDERIRVVEQRLLARQRALGFTSPTSAGECAVPRGRDICCRPCWASQPRC